MTLLPESELAQQIERLVTSPVLAGSESLCRLLRYLGEQAAAQPGVPVREYQIATEVFGRSAEFDSRTDAIVRVQTGRLRNKLAEHYRGPGAEDPWIVEIPKGSYLLVVSPRPVEPAPAPEPEPVAEPVLPEPVPVQPAPAPMPVPRRNWPAWIFGALSLVLAAVVAYLLWGRPNPCQ